MFNQAVREALDYLEFDEVPRNFIWTDITNHMAVILPFDLEKEAYRLSDIQDMELRKQLVQKDIDLIKEYCKHPKYFSR